MKPNFFFLIFSGLIWFSMPKSQAQQKLEKNDLATVYDWVSGSFSSEAQFKSDSGYFNISLKMRPVWKSRKGEHWIYLEQAIVASMDKPYRQRMVQLTQKGDSVILATIYDLPGPGRFTGAYDRPEAFDQLKPDSIRIKEGCAFSIRKVNSNTYSGATSGKLCHSALKGASYSTTRVTITKNQVLSWDQGWDAEDKLVWGAVKGPYQFVKMEKW